MLIYRGNRYCLQCNVVCNSNTVDRMKSSNYIANECIFSGCVDNVFAAKIKTDKKNDIARLNCRKLMQQAAGSLQNNASLAQN